MVDLTVLKRRVPTKYKDVVSFRLKEPCSVEILAHGVPVHTVNAYMDIRLQRLGIQEVARALDTPMAHLRQEDPVQRAVYRLRSSNNEDPGPEVSPVLEEIKKEFLPEQHHEVFTFVRGHSGYVSWALEGTVLGTTILKWDNLTYDAACRPLRNILRSVGDALDTDLADLMEQLDALSKGAIAARAVREWRLKNG